MAIEKTYSMIKPDGVRNGHIGEIVNRFERAGLKIERMEMGMVTPEQAAANYQEHEGKPFYDGLISYITSGPVVKMVVSGEGAVAKCLLPHGRYQPCRGSSWHHPWRLRPDHGRKRNPRLRLRCFCRARDLHLLLSFFVASFMERRNICFGRNYATRALDDAAVGLNSLGARGALEGGFPRLHYQGLV